MEDAAQAMGAGLTYGNRYYLMKQLQLATTESDPDNYRSKQKEADNYEEEAAAKAAAEALSKAVAEIVDAGSKLIKAGVNKDAIREAVAKHNGGDGNPSSIRDIEICTKVIEEFKLLGTKKPTKKTKVEGETK
jgi:hypothetical protein